MDKTALRIISALVLVCTSRHSSLADETVFPDQDWQQASPESQAVDSAKLEAAVAYLEQNAPHDGVKRLVIVRNGRVIWKGPEADRRQRVWPKTRPGVRCLSSEGEPGGHA